MYVTCSNSTKCAVVLHLVKNTVYRVSSEREKERERLLEMEECLSGNTAYSLYLEMLAPQGGT